MGIRGLATVMRNNPSLLDDFRLHDTKVVIDGHNLFHQLYEIFPAVCTQYGGDYNVYADVVKYIFKQFQMCNVSPYVVFEGAYSEEDLGPVLSRTIRKIKEAEKACKGQACQILPVLTYETFHSVLAELNVPRVTCDSSAKDQIIVLANELKCPIISDNSLFYVFNVNGGFIPVKSIIFKIKSSMVEQYKYLPAKLYHRNALDKKLPKSKGLALPLLAAISGNAFLDGDILEEFYDTLSVSTRFSSDFKIPPYYVSAIDIIHWLERLDCDAESIIEKLVSFVPTEKKDLVKTSLEETLQMFETMDLYSSFNLREFFFDGASAQSNDDQAVSCSSGSVGLSPDSREKSEPIFRNNGSPLPAWFYLGHRQSLFPGYILDVIKTSRIFLACGAEKIAESSSYNCSRRIRLVVYGIMKAGIQETTNDNRDPVETSTVDEHSRQKTSLTLTFLPASSVKDENRDPVETTTVKEHSRQKTSPTLTGFPPSLVKDDNRDPAETTAVKEHSTQKTSPTLTVFPPSLVKDDNGDPVETTTVEEYSRRKTNLTLTFIQPLAKVFRYGCLPTLEEVGSLSPEKKRSLVYCSLDLKEETDVDAFPENLKLVAATIIYWIQNSDPKPSQNNVTALLVYIMIRNLHLVLQTEITEDKETMWKIKNNFRDYFKEWTKVGRLNMDIVHVFAQFQTCIKASTALNQLLLSPLVTPNPADCFSGTFVYNLSVDLDGMPNSHQTLNSMISNATVQKVFESWTTSIFRYNDGDSYQDVKGKARVKPKKTSTADDENISKSYKDREEIRRQLPPSNRFACLNIDDSD